MRLKNTVLILMSTILVVSCSKTERLDTEEKNHPVEQSESKTLKVKSSKTNSSEPTPVDVAVERAIKKMSPEQKQILNKTPLTVERYPSPPEPNFGPKTGSIRFTDMDPGRTIGGTLTMARAIDQNGQRIDEVVNGITSYSIHWGLEVASPGIEDDKGNGDLGGDCMNFRDPSYIVKTPASATPDLLSWEIPFGTVVPENAVYFVGLTQYGTTYNLKKCTQIPIENLIEQ